MKHDYNSPANQAIKSELVAREVISNLGPVFTFLSENGASSWQEEYDDLHSTPDYAKTLEYNDVTVTPRDENGTLYSTDYQTAFTADTDQEACEELGLDLEYHEILEYWAISAYLGEKLGALGEPVQEMLGFTVWGRGCSGQAIMLDDQISQIAEGMEILEGQANDWS